jgi:replicative DNA helicase
MAKNDDTLRRVPPQNIEAEQSVLGAILLEGDKPWFAQQVADELAPEDFYRDTHREIFKAMIELADKKAPIDAVTLTDALRARGVLEQVGGVAYLAELAVAVPTSATVNHYASMVWKQARYREFINTATDLTGEAYQAMMSIDGFIGEAEHRLQDIFNKVWKLHRRAPRQEKIIEAASGMLQGIAPEKLIKTGFSLLDARVWLMPGDLITLAAETSLGKTSMVGNIALNVARQAKGVVLFSYEMSEEQLMQRLISSLQDIPADRGQWGKYDELYRQRIKEASEFLAELRLGVVWARGMKPRALRTELRRQQFELGVKVKLVIVDYLQLMQADRPNRNRDQDYDDIVAFLKDLAGEFECAVILVSQFNREGTRRANENTVPRVSDLRGSSAIEQYSDGIWFLWRPDKQFPTKVTLSVAKNRNGGIARIELLHIPEFLKFEQRKQTSYGG